MAKFAYKNTKNTNTGYIFFKVNYGYHFRASNEENVNPRSRSKLADELVTKLRELRTICRENFDHPQEL